MSLHAALQALNALSRSLLTAPPDDFLRQVADSAVESLSASACVVWKSDERSEKLFVAAATDSVDEQLKKIALPLDTPVVAEFLLSDKTGRAEDTISFHPGYNRLQDEASKRGWTSLLAAPMSVGDEPIGVLVAYYQAAPSLTTAEKSIFNTFAHLAAAAIQQSKLHRKEVSARERLQEINYRITTANNLDELLRLLLDNALILANSQRGWISLLNPDTGMLEVVTHRGITTTPKALTVGEGIAGLSLWTESPINVTDVAADEWRNVHVPYWPDTRSVLAVPIFVANATARVGRRIVSTTKPVAVLNLESPEVNAFSVADAESIGLCVGLAAIQIDRMELERKLNSLRRVETEIVGNRSFDETVGTLMRGITDILHYDYVNISLVVPEINLIRTEYAVGIPENRIEEFKRLSVHSLDSQDIQAHVVRTREVEVPVDDDPRFDRMIYDRFDHKELLRVILPMVVQSDGRVLGTLEAGYRRTSYRRYIYEQDVRILRSILDYAVQALEQRDKRMLETFSHEFRAPLVGLRSNIDFLQRRRSQLQEELIDRKFNDMNLDCEILLQQVETLEYFLGSRPRTSRLEYTLVVRDIIIKMINQLKPLVAERGFDIRRIELSPYDSGMIRLNVDRAKLSRVFYNLLINAIKYAEDDPKEFAIRIALDQNKDYYIISIKDWGIGVETGMEEKIFEKGFRTPHAVSRNLIGTGLGLTIARSIMRDMGGDLILANRYKPTEFHVHLPKNVRGVK